MRQLDDKIAELKKLMGAEKLDTKAIVSLSREIDSIQREADKAEVDKAQKAFAVLNAHVNGELIKVIKPIIADGGIQKLHGDVCTLRFSVAFSAETEPVFSTVISSGAAKAPKSGSGGGGGGGQRGNWGGLGIGSGADIVARYGTNEQKASYEASTDKNVRYGFERACAKQHQS